MATLLTWLIALIRGWLGIKADIHDKEEQEVGAEKDHIANDGKMVSELEEAHEADISNAGATDNVLRLQTAKFNRDG